MVARRVPIGQSHHDVERGQGEHEVEEGPGVVNSVVLRVVRFTCNKPGGYILHFPPPPPSKIGKKLQIPNKNRSSNNTATNYLRTDPPLRSWTRDRSDAQCRSSSTWRPGPSNLSCAVAKWAMTKRSRIILNAVKTQLHLSWVTLRIAKYNKSCHCKACFFSYENLILVTVKIFYLAFLMLE